MAVIATVLLASAGFTLAETHKNMMVHSTAMTRGHGGVFGHGGHGRWRDTLDKSQKKKIDAMHLALKREMIPLRAELSLRMAELRNMVTVKAPDKTAIRKKIREIGALRDRIMEKRYSHILEMRKVLMPDQRRSFDLEFISGTGHWRSHEGN